MVTGIKLYFRNVYTNTERCRKRSRYKRRHMFVHVSSFGIGVILNEDEEASIFWRESSRDRALLPSLHRGEALSQLEPGGRGPSEMQW